MINFERCDGPTWLEKTAKGRALWLVTQNMPLGIGDFPYLKGCRVYLVGSALTSETRPRDIDVRVVVPSERFRERFGSSPDEARGMPALMDLAPPPAFWAIREEERRLAEVVSYATGERMIDLSIHDEVGWTRWYARAPHELLAPWSYPA